MEYGQHIESKGVESTLTGQISTETENQEDSSDMSDSKHSGHHLHIRQHLKHILHRSKNTREILVPGKVGLRNLGNTCFINSILQCFSNNPTMLQILTEDFVEQREENHPIGSPTKRRKKLLGSILGDRSETSKSTDNREEAEDKNLVPPSLFLQLQQLFGVIWSGKWLVVSPNSFVNTLWTLMPKFLTGQQQDAQEFWLFLVDRLHAEMTVGPVLRRAIAIYNFNSERAREMSFKEGDIVTILKKNQDGWWQGELQEKRGSIPCNYLEEISEEYPRKGVVLEEIEGDEFSKYIHKGDTVNIWKIVRHNKKSWTLCERQRHVGWVESDVVNVLPQERRLVPTPSSAIMDLFQGQLISRITCLLCGKTSSSSEPFFDLSLDLPITKRSCSLEECLAKFTSNESLDSWHCNTCTPVQSSPLTPGKNGRSTKGMRIKRLPNVLVIVLKRFSWSVQEKIDTRVHFPFELDMKGFTEPAERQTKFQIQSVVVHHGPFLEEGHYSTYCHWPNMDSWLHFNDSEVAFVKEKEAMSSKAYMLFYQRL